MNWKTITSTFLAEPLARYVLVSLVGKKGASYLQPGARMLVREDGCFWGSISAGCLEETVAQVAVECLKRKEHQVMEIDTRPYYGCFGQISVLLEVLPEGEATLKLMEDLAESLRVRKAITLVTEFKDMTPDRLTRIGDAKDQSMCLVEKVTPSTQLLVFGDWPDGQAVARIAQAMDWDVHVYDASVPGFYTDEILSGITVDGTTGAVVMTHNFGRDIHCLQSLLRLPFGYIGVIGSRKRWEEISNEIMGEEDLELIDAMNRVHCPAGLDLGGEGAEAIGLSVVAEIQATFLNRDGSFLKDRKQPIHSGDDSQ